MLFLISVSEKKKKICHYIILILSRKLSGLFASKLSRKSLEISFNRLFRPGVRL